MEHFCWQKKNPTICCRVRYSQYLYISLTGNKNLLINKKFENHSSYFMRWLFIPIIWLLIIYFYFFFSTTITLILHKIRIYFQFNVHMDIYFFFFVVVAEILLRCHMKNSYRLNRIDVSFFFFFCYKIKQKSIR